MSGSLKELSTLAYSEKLKEHPSVPVHAIPYPKYSDKTANGLTKCILDFVKFSGGYAVRIQTQGQYNPKLKKWTKGTTTKGTADVHIVFNGLHASVEVKIGRDRMSDDQKTTRDKITQAGGLYYVAKTYPDFHEWFIQTFKPGANGRP